MYMLVYHLHIDVACQMIRTNKRKELLAEVDVKNLRFFSLNILQIVVPKGYNPFLFFSLTQ